MALHRKSVWFDQSKVDEHSLFLDSAVMSVYDRTEVDLRTPAVLLEVPKSHTRVRYVEDMFH